MTMFKSIINDHKKVKELIDIFKVLKSMNQYTKMICKEEEIFIQTMDDSHISLLEIHINSEWFSEYESSNIVLSFNTDIFLKILTLYTLNASVEISCNAEADKLNISLISERENKYFTLPLIDLDSDIMDSQDLETSVDFELNTKLFDKFISELSVFGDSMYLICKNDTLFLSSKNEHGEMKIEIDGEKLVEFSSVEDISICSEFMIKYISYITKLGSIYSNIHIYFDKDMPLMIKFDENQIKINYYIAPKTSDDDELEQQLNDDENHIVT